MSEQELQVELYKKELKIKALLEDITTTRENNADLRVELTVLSQQSNEMRNRLDANETTEASDETE